MNDSPQMTGGGPETLAIDHQGPAAKAGGLNKNVTLVTVAREVGLSQGAVSSLLNDRDYGIRVSPKTREGVFQACRRLGYIPNDLRALVRIYPELGETCLLVSSAVRRGVANPFVARLAETIMDRAGRRPSSLGVILFGTTDVGGPDAILPIPIKNGTASRILCVGLSDESLRSLVGERRIPAVVIGHASENPGTASVLPDYVAAARLALGALWNRGHRRIGILAGPTIDPEPRLAATNLAVAGAADELGLAIDTNDIFPGALDFESGVAAVNAMLARTDRPTALLCLAEASAIGALAAAHHHGIHIPDELSVITFADHANMLDSCIPLTAVVLPVEELASAATAEAERQLQSGIPATAIRLTVPVRLIERATCGPVRVAQP